VCRVPGVGADYEGWFETVYGPLLHQVDFVAEEVFAAGDDADVGLFFEVAEGDLGVLAECFSVCRRQSRWRAGDLSS
jgi:hypothetical protein